MTLSQLTRNLHYQCEVSQGREVSQEKVGPRVTLFPTKGICDSGESSNHRADLQALVGSVGYHVGAISKTLYTIPNVAWHWWACRSCRDGSIRR